MGIGSATPAKLLDVAGLYQVDGSTGTATHNFPDMSGGALIAKYAGTQVFNATYATMTIGPWQAGAGYTIQTNSNAAALNLNVTTAAPLMFSTSNTERMRILSGGNVGIGTNNPAKLLSLESSSTSDTSIRLKNTSTGGGDWMLGSYGSANGGGVGRFAIWDAMASANRLVIDGAGNVGIGTTAPAFNLDVSGSSATSNGIGIRIFNSNASNTNGWWLGTGGGAVPSSSFSIADNTTYRMTFSSTGNVGIGTTSPIYALDVVGGIRSTSGGITFPDGTTQSTAAVSSTCRTGYVLVPADPNGVFSFKPFCVMKYAASQDATTKTATSVAANTPWTTINWYEAKDQCQRIGTHLITEGEWMTIARNIEATAINNLDGSNPIHLATGHSNNNPASGLAATTDPSMASCNVNYALSHANNSSCALKASSAGTGSYYGETGASDYYTGTYSAGAAGMAQMRTFVLSNGNILWDVAGNVGHWTDMQCGSNVWPNSGAWWDWNNASIASVKLFAGPSGSEISTGGAGLYYGCTAVGNAMFRGRSYASMSLVGVFSADLGNSPSNANTTIGFRCAYAP